MRQLTAEDRITQANIALMGDKRTLAYSGVLMIGTSEVVENVPTARTNGRDIKYGRAFIDSLTDQEVRALVLHEKKHCLYQHLFIWRGIYKEDPDLANQACDYVINLEIADLDSTGEFIKLPACGLLDRRFRGMDSGQVFKILKEEGKGGRGGMDQHDWESAEQLTQEEQQALAKEIESAVRTGALLAGKKGGDVDRGFEAVMQPQVDWKEQLREFVSSICAGKGDSTWARPNRRWLQYGIYMPSQISESIGNMVVGIDTSGSIGSKELTAALSELVGICDNTSPEKLHLLYWDTRVASHEVYVEGEYGGLLSSTKPKGGGGSSSVATFEYIADNKLDPLVCVMITDGYIEYPRVVPPYPVLWVIVGENKNLPPFGSVVRVKL